MNVELLFAKDVFKDDNDGFLFGIQELDDFPAYIEWFKTEKERDKVIKENGFKVKGEN
jgi:hypothetical protein